MEVIGICRTGEEAIECAKSDKPDLILMDIQLAGKIDGIAAAQKICEHQNIPIIYLSDYSDKDTLDRAKKTRPANYLAKPFLETDLIRAIDIAFSNAQYPSANNQIFNEHFFLRTDSQTFVKIAYTDILFLKADRAYCNVVTAEKNYTLSSSMKNVFEQFNHPDFAKVHRSFIINTKQITALDGNVIHLGEQQVVMSKEYRDDLMHRIKIIK